VWTWIGSGSAAQQAESQVGAETQRRVLRVVWIPDAERDTVAAVTPRRAQRAAYGARSDDRDLDVSLLLRRVRLAGYLCLSRAYPMI
jgi:hypothetical protein